MRRQCCLIANSCLSPNFNIDNFRIFRTLEALWQKDCQHCHNFRIGQTKPSLWKYCKYLRDKIADVCERLVNIHQQTLFKKPWSCFLTLKSVCEYSWNQSFLYKLILASPANYSWNQLFLYKQILASSPTCKYLHFSRRRCLRKLICSSDWLGRTDSIKYSI